MKKRTYKSLILCLLITLLTGCASWGLGKANAPGYNTAFEKYAKEQVLGLIINEPTAEQLSSLDYLETYQDSDPTEKLLIIPKYNQSSITIERIAFENDQLVSKETLYHKEQTEEGYGLLLETVRPEGIPQLKVTLTHQAQSVSYIVAYNGKEGTPEQEYLQIEEIQQPEKPGQDEALREIQPQVEGKLLEGFNLLDQKAVDIDADQVVEQLEVYSTAGYDTDGQLLLNDGQEWAVIVRKGDQIYPVFEPDYIQLGQIEYKVYTEYAEENIFHILVSKVQGAGIQMYDAYYDRVSDTFKSKLVFQTEGNIGIGESYYGVK